MAELAIVIPSRGRPEQCARLVDRIAETATTDPVVAVVFDHDDPRFTEYFTFPEAPAYPVVSQGSGHVAAINRGAQWALEYLDLKAVAKLDDDHWPITKGWDRQLLDALEELGGEGIVYGNDLLQGERLPTAPVISAGISRALGWMGPPALHHLYVDDFWRDLGVAVGCLRYVPQVIVEHRHPLAGKSEMDEGYRRVNQPTAYSRDEAAYAAFRADGFDKAVAAVKELRSDGTRG